MSRPSTSLRYAQDERLEGWEERLVAVIDASRALPYELGVHDCFRLACRVVEALTGVDRWPEFAGYTTKREALAAIGRYGRTFEKAGDWFCGSEHVAVSYARRGDIVAYADAAGEKHLGVCVDGVNVAVMHEGGLAFVSLETCICAWRIG